MASYTPIAAPQQSLDDAVSLDENEIHGLVSATQPAIARPAPSTTEVPGSETNPAPSTNPSHLSQLSFLVPPVEDLDRRQAHLKHPTTTALERKLGATVLELADFWFCQGSPYDHMCLARSNWRYSRSSGWDVGTFHTRAEFHLFLYAYIVRRSAAIGILLARGYEVLDRGISAGDDAFALIVEAMVHNWEDLRGSGNIVDWPERGRRATVMVDHPRLKKAVEIIGQLPMRWNVKLLGEDEVVFFWFGGERGSAKGTLDVTMDAVTMECVAVKDADEVCDANEYRV